MQRLLLFLVFLLDTTAASAGEARHGFAYFGELKYPANMPHFDYVNPNAPKGGTVRVPFVGTFNNLNLYVDKGILQWDVAGRAYVGGGALVLEPLMRASEDELRSYYGRLAKTIEIAEDYSWVKYTLRKIAKWHDGEAVTVDDVIWTYNAIKDRGSPQWKSRLQSIDRIEQTGQWSFKFHFADSAVKNPQLILQTAGFVPYPKHFWETRKFDATTVEPPLGNGAYKIHEVDPGRKITFERVANYWARDLNVTTGYYNFDRLEVIYFFNKSVMLQALRAGALDYFRDEVESDFATEYDFAGYRSGLFNKATYTMGYSYGMHLGIVLNQRRAPFDDVLVREALTLAYNFEWANRVYWYGGMTRNSSYFSRSGMQAQHLPSGAELALLEPFKDQLPPRVFTQSVTLPENHAFGRNRLALQRADTLLKDAGWVVEDFKRVHDVTKTPLRFEIFVSRNDHERLLVPFVDNLKRLGIDAVLRKVESNLLTNRMRTFDYDAMVAKMYTFNPPSPERLRSHFTSAYADTDNMMNYAGIKNTVVDALVQKVINSTTETQMQVAGRALDRVLFWNFYVIPDGHPKGRHIVFWDRIDHPPLGAEHMNWTGFPYLWWFDKDKSAAVDAGLEANKL